MALAALQKDMTSLDCSEYKMRLPQAFLYKAFLSMQPNLPEDLKSAAISFRQRPISKVSTAPPSFFFFGLIGNRIYGSYRTLLFGAAFQKILLQGSVSYDGVSQESEYPISKPSTKRTAILQVPTALSTRINNLKPCYLRREDK